VADRIITHVGSPTDWGTLQTAPSELGLATYPSTDTYALDIDKIGRLNRQNINSLGYVDLLTAAQISSISLGISVTQVMDLTVTTSSTYTIDSETYVALDISAHINSKASSATLHSYVVADNFFYNSTVAIPDSGSYTLTVHLPTSLVDEALVVAFARASCDQRITSYAVYNIAESKQETTPSSTNLSLSPQGYTLNFDGSTGIALENVYVLTYSYSTNVTSLEASSCSISRLIDNSPYVLVACGVDGSVYVQEWISYPPVPLSAGSSFNNSERNVFSYIVTVEGVFYRVEVSLGDINQ
jgi:hypothetical protein